jgi:hypothetical protein
MIFLISVSQVARITGMNHLCYRRWCSLWSEDPDFCAPNGKIQGEHMRGWGGIALLRKGESPVLPGEEREEKAEDMMGTGRIHWQTDHAFLF